MAVSAAVKRPLFGVESRCNRSAATPTPPTGRNRL
jgi:hypothetical protein